MADSDLSESEFDRRVLLTVNNELYDYDSDGNHDDSDEPMEVDDPLDSPMEVDNDSDDNNGGFENNNQNDNDDNNGEDDINDNNSEDGNNDDTIEEDNNDSNDENNPEIEDPDFNIGEDIASFENDDLKISYKRIKFKKFERFNLTDYNFSINITMKTERQSILMTTALESILEALARVFNNIKNDFAPNLDRNMYVTFIHKDLNPPVTCGPLNFKDSTVEEMVETCHIKLNAVLESHKTLTIDKNLVVLARTLGSKHMKFIRDRQKRLDKLSAIPMKGEEKEEEKTEDSLIKLPIEEFPYFKDKCLPIGIVLGSIIEKGHILKERNFITAGNILNNIKSTNAKLRRQACKRLEVEFEKVLKKIPKLRDLEDYTFENTCQILAMHFNVNIVMHELKYELDHIVFVQSPTKKAYDVSLPRIDLLAFRKGDLNEGHVDLIHPRNHFYKKHRKWACVFCSKIIQTHWQTHMCTAQGQRVVSVLT